MTDNVIPFRRPERPSSPLTLHPYIELLRRYDSILKNPEAHKAELQAENLSD